MKIKLLLAFSLFQSFFATAQEDKKKEYNMYRLPIVGLGTGILAFNGDVANDSKQNAFSKFRPGYNLYVEQRVLPFLGIAVNGLYGKLSANERSATSNRNFQSKLIQGDLNIMFHFDGLIQKKEAGLTPFLGVGVGYTMFDAYGDLKDKNNKNYNYWKDGSIRDLPEADSNIFKSVVIQRDYKYETKLTDSTTNYKRAALVIPVTAGITMKLTDALNLNLVGTYYMAQTDWIDNVKNGKNDSYFYASFCLKYNLGYKAEGDDEAYKNVDFKALDHADSDGDGVDDVHDRCPGTPKGAKADSHGCPPDDDNDGVPNYMDKEPTTKAGAVVTPEGITLTEAEMEKMASDTLSMSHDDALRMELMKKDSEISASKANGTFKGGNLPAEFQFADTNGDGIITSNEITGAIDAFFEGGANITVDKINKLIDYFFEQ